LRRFFFFLLAVVAVAGLTWGAALKLTRPVGSADDHGPRRFDMAVAEAKALPPSAIDYARLDQRLQRLMDDPSMVGLAVAVVEDGEIRFARGYGVTTAGTEDPVTTETVFRWASLSKGVAADMVVLLADRQQLQLFAPVSRYSASLKLPGAGSGKPDLVNTGTGGQAAGLDQAQSSAADESGLWVVVLLVGLLAAVVTVRKVVRR